MPERATTGLPSSTSAKLPASSQAAVPPCLRLPGLRTANLRWTALKEWSRLFITHFLSSYFLKEKNSEKFFCEKLKLPKFRFE